MATTKITPLIVIVGETASGKSALAMRLAKKFRGEIICADSWTVYQGFDIGTNKPTTTDQQQIPHHLLDIARPEDGFSAPEFKKKAVAAIDAIASRGNLPIMVGGTGLYIDSVLYDYTFLPAGKTGQREQLNQLTLDDLRLLAQSLRLDLDRIDTQNKRRIIRLIESNGQLPGRKPLRLHTLIIGCALPRELLQERIEKRINKMLAAGLEGEVRQLAARYGWEVEPMKGIGYHEFRAYIKGEQTLAQTQNQIIKNTLDLAKRQRTWFKRNNSIHWITEQIEVVDLTTTLLNK